MRQPTAPLPPTERALSRAIRTFERLVIYALVAMMIVVVTLSTLELGWILAKDMVTAPVLLLDVEELFDIFGFFLLILIGVELLETIKAYLRDNVIHVEIVLEVALIAIARKVIVLDLEKHDGARVFAVAALIVALAVAFYLQRRRRRASGQGADPERGPDSGSS